MVVVALRLLGTLNWTSIVGYGLYRSYQSLSPSQDTRPRLAKRARLVSVFAVLAGLSLVVASYSTVQHATLSYQVWADERGIDLPR